MATMATAIKKKQIVWISPGFAASEKDDTCIPVLQDLALELTRDPEIDLRIIALHYPHERKDYLWNGIPVMALGGNNKRGWSKLLLLPDFFRLLNRFDKEQGIDVLHSFWLADSTVFTFLWNLFHHKKHLCTLMGQEAKGKFYFKFLPLKRFECFSLSEYAREKFYSSTGRNSLLNPFGLPDLKLAEVKRDIDMLSVGAIIPLKNHIFFLELLKAVKEHLPEVKAIIVGEPHDKEELKKLESYISKENLGNNVTLLPKQSRMEIRHLMNRSRCLVHGAKFESQGMVKQEALQLGCVVFSSAAGIQFDHPQFRPLSSDLKSNVDVLLHCLLSAEETRALNLIPISATAQVYRKHYNDH